MKQLKSLFCLNKDDFLVYFSILLPPFLGLHLILFGVIAVVKPESVPLFGSFLLAFLLAIVAFLACFSHISLSFSQYITFGYNRKRALGLSFSVATLQTLCSTVLVIALSLLEQRFALSLFSRFSGHTVIEVFPSVPLWIYPLIALGGLILGLIGGAVILRFGRVGGWILYGLFMAACLSPQYLPWHKYTITNWLFPLLGIVILAWLIWSVWSLLHTSVK